MAKFCGNCGTKLEDNARVCSQCGTSVGGIITKNAERRKDIEKKVKLVAILVSIALVAGISLHIASKFTGANGLLRKVMTAYRDYDIDTLVSLSSDVYYYGDTSEGVEYYFEYRLGDNLDYFESQIGHNYKFSYEVQEIYDASGREFNTTLEDLENIYQGFDIDTIQRVKIADVKITATEGTSSSSRFVQVTMTKENGEWRLLYIQ